MGYVAPMDIHTYEYTVHVGSRYAVVIGTMENTERLNIASTLSSPTDS